jgi:ABC-type Fe3+-hydroxamate transport system substrate-binding protein
VTDARGVPLALARPPQRVVSLVPSTTETLFDLGLPPVGVTRFCVHPRAARGLPKVGGTKDLDLDRLAALDPDLVVGNAEENTREIFAAVEGRWPVWVAFPRTVDQAVADIAALGVIVGRSAEPWLSAIAAARATVPRAPFRYVYLVWRRPWMAAGPDTFVAAMLAEAGGVNVVPQGRYPEVEVGLLREADLVLLPSEPFPFQERHAAELGAATGLPLHRFRKVDGAMLSWHGTRMAQGLAYLARFVGELPFTPAAPA